LDTRPVRFSKSKTTETLPDSAQRVPHSILRLDGEELGFKSPFVDKTKTGNNFRGLILEDHSLLKSFHSGDYEEWCLLECYAVWLL
jgi:hypothetical protein